MLEVSPEQVKRLVLDVQGLRTDNPCKSVVDVANRIHNIQIDTMSVVGRSHDLVLFNRLPSYKEGDIWDELHRGTLFQYWSHAMCLLPIESFPYYSLRMQTMSFGELNYWTRWAKRNSALIEEVYSFIKKNGVTSSSDFKSAGPKGWGGSNQSRAMQFLHLSGKLLVAYRENFQKFYDLTERVLPTNADSEPMDQTEADLFTVETTLESLGLGSQMDIQLYLGRFKARKKWGASRVQLKDYLQELVGQGLLQEVQIDEVPESYFILSKSVSKLEDASNAEYETAPVKMLSPFDNIVRERHLPQELWRFDYKLEAYTPPDQRKYGYHVLPILDGINLIGRVDAKMHRKAGYMELISLFLEDDFWKSDEGLVRLVDGMKQFARFHGTDSIHLRRVEPKGIRSRLSENL